MKKDSFSSHGLLASYSSFYWVYSAHQAENDFPQGSSIPPVKTKSFLKESIQIPRFHIGQTILPGHVSTMIRQGKHRPVTAFTIIFITTLSLSL